MKKIYTILVACILLVVSNVSAQKITPIQLKHARMSVHQWVRDYDIYAQMAERRNPTKKFTSLFENADLQIMNDYLPSIPAQDMWKSYSIPHRLPCLKLNW